VPGDRENPLFAIVGPTGVGKTAMAVEIASRLPMEIISVDSRQVYRYMDIGTAKPSPEERGKARHHLIDVAYPDETFNAGRFAREALEAMGAIRKAGKTPLLVGGTGLYLKALIHGLIKGPPADEEFRKKLRKEASSKGEGTLHSKLREIDPRAADRIHHHDLVRITRALEIHHLTGKTLTRHIEDDRPESLEVTLFGLAMERGQLYARLDDRVDRMMEKGFVDEVNRLLESGYGEDLTAMQGIGYRQMTALLRGNNSQEEAVSSTKKETRNLAKRQMTWFRGTRGVRWHDLSSPASGEKALEEITGTITRGMESSPGKM
jgi:tRNA dimethylallyltransferase